MLILECYQVAIRLKIHLAMDVGETTLSTLNWIEDWLCIFSILCEFGVELGMPSPEKSAVFLNIVQKAFDPPPLLFEHLSYFAGGVF